MENIPTNVKQPTKRDSHVWVVNPGLGSGDKGKVAIEQINSGLHYAILF
jgi:hypothetical protein